MKTILLLLLLFIPQTSTLNDYNQELNKKYLQLVETNNDNASKAIYMVVFSTEENYVEFITSSYTIRVDIDSECVKNSQGYLVKTKHSKDWYQFIPYTYKPR